MAASVLDHILKLEIYKNIGLEGGKSKNKSLQFIGRTRIFWWKNLDL